MANSFFDAAAALVSEEEESADVCEEEAALATESEEEAAAALTAEKEAKAAFANEEEAAAAKAAEDVGTAKASETIATAALGEWEGVKSRRGKGKKALSKNNVTKSRSNYSNMSLRPSSSPSKPPHIEPILSSETRRQEEKSHRPACSSEALKL